jgi:hypothetical protein
MRNSSSVSILGIVVCAAVILGLCNCVFTHDMAVTSKDAVWKDDSTISLLIDNAEGYGSSDNSGFFSSSRGGSEKVEFYDYNAITHSMNVVNTSSFLDGHSYDQIVHWNYYVLCMTSDIRSYFFDLTADVKLTLDFEAYRFSRHKGFIVGKVPNTTASYCIFDCLHKTKDSLASAKGRMTGPKFYDELKHLTINTIWGNPYLMVCDDNRCDSVPLGGLEFQSIDENGNYLLFAKHSASDSLYCANADSLFNRVVKIDFVFPFNYGSFALNETLKKYVRHYNGLFLGSLVGPYGEEVIFTDYEKKL